MLFRYLIQCRIARVRGCEAKIPALTGLRQYLTEQEFSLKQQLPAERDLSTALGVSRTDLRKALAVLEAEGRIGAMSAAALRRHAPGPEHRRCRISERRDQPAAVMEGAPSDSSRSSPASPPCTRRTPTSHRCAPASAPAGRRVNGASTRPGTTSCTAPSPRGDPQQAADQPVRHIEHGPPLDGLGPAALGRSCRPANHHSFAEHDCLYDAISQRDTDVAAECMRRHLRSVRDRILAGLNA